MKRIVNKLTLAVLVVSMTFGMFAACGNKGNATYDNETTPLTLATQELDEVFNPFFATSGYDTNIVGHTQLGMLNTDKNGDIEYGEGVPCVVEDYIYTAVDTRADKDPSNEDYDNWYATYEFLIKDGLKFSDGSDLTIKDILFNMYLYLDPVYTGSSTLYSVNIKGLSAYRSQTDNPNEQANFEQLMDDKADARVNAVKTWANNTNMDATAAVAADLLTIKTLFHSELESDWSSAAGSVESYATDYPGEGITETWQVFFLMEGLSSADRTKPEGEQIDWGGMDEIVAGWKAEGKSESELKTLCVDLVYDDMVGDDVVLSKYKQNIYAIVSYWATAASFREAMIADEKSKYFEENKKPDGSLQVASIEGIVAKKVSTFNNKTVGSGRDVLSITINGVDPKAIYNFSFGVAPMKYYSTQELCAEANPDENKFGVDFGNTDFMNETVKMRGVPIGAGPYKAVSEDKNEFFKDNVVSFERNEYFLLGAPKIKKLRFQVINNTRFYDVLKNGDIHYAEPNAQIETIQDIEANQPQLGKDLIDNVGYGYIGISAAYVPEINVRRAIMSALDPTLSLDYYTNGMATVVYRPMSKVSWAYPENCTAYDEPGSSIAYDPTGAKAKEYIESTVYTKNSKGIYEKTNKKGLKEELKLTFTIAGETEAHPAAATFTKAAEILNSIGCKITVINDPNALKKLANAELAVWAAAWSSTIDPDMFQVYHKDSKATSVNNWGYSTIFAESENYGEEIAIIDELSDIIENARKITEQSARKVLYAQALDKVMELAIEFPMYQRKNLFVWDKNVIDESTLVPATERTPYNGPMARIWEVSFNIN